MPNALDLLLKRGRDEKEGAAPDRRQKRLRPIPKVHSVCTRNRLGTLLQSKQVSTFLQAPEHSVCPVCNRRFPIPRLEAHVNLCLASQQHREQVLARSSNAGGTSASAESALSAAHRSATQVACAAESFHCLQARAVHLPQEMQLQPLWMPQLLATSCHRMVAA